VKNKVGEHAGEGIDFSVVIVKSIMESWTRSLRKQVQVRAITVQRLKRREGDLSGTKHARTIPAIELKSKSKTVTLKYMISFSCFDVEAL